MIRFKHIVLPAALALTLSACGQQTEQEKVNAAIESADSQTENLLIQINGTETADGVMAIVIPDEMSTKKQKELNKARADQLEKLFLAEMTPGDLGSAVAVYTREDPDGKLADQRAISAFQTVGDFVDREIESANGNKSRLRALYNGLPEGNKFNTMKKRINAASS